MIKHQFILLDNKLKSLAEERRWKEYNSLCYILSVNVSKDGVPKADQQSLLSLSRNGVLVDKCNVCAICIKRHTA